MKQALKMIAYILLITFVLNIFPLSVFAKEIREPNVTVLANDFIKITVDNATGRFGIRTVDGQPIKKKDQNVNMLFGGDDPQTSFTTLKINGTDYIFGNPYKFAVDFFSEVKKPKIVYNADGTKQIETVWKVKGVEVKQILKLYSDPKDKKNAGNVGLRYEVTNNSDADINVGSRILLDTMVGGNDGPAFQIGTAYKVPLMVERKLIHNPEDDSSISEEERALYKLPSYWVMRDRLDLLNPLATNVVAYGFNNFSEGNVNIVDEMIVGHWNSLANTKWDYTVNPNLDFTRDTNDFGTADSAVAFYWNPDNITIGNTKTFETVYGLGEIIEPDKVFSMRFMDPVEQLGTLDDGSNYESEGVFDITAEVENLEMFNMEHSKIGVELTLESGLDFVKLDERGNIVRDGNGKIVTLPYRSTNLEFKKEATPEEASQGISPKYKPGETVTASFKVKAKGKPWPSTKEYMITAKSPETQKKLEDMEDEAIKAEYTSSKGGFIFLPPVGQATPTYVYAMSPKEAYSKDEKYITLNMSNIEAYNVGNANTEPNFDLYLKDKVSGKRYRVPVKESVIIQPTDDGLVGDMRITYRTGDLVDEKGEVVVDKDGKKMTDLGPELPLGEYFAEIDFKGDTGGDLEVAEMYDITTEQTFMVTDNEEARIREAKVLAVYKTTVDLSANAINASEKLEEINEAFPGYNVESNSQLLKDISVFSAVRTVVNQASKAVDSGFETSNILDVSEVPAYRLMPFESEDEFEELKDRLSELQGNDEEDAEDNDEILVEIRGMIKQIGKGEDVSYVVDTTTEPAIINESVAYKGKDLVFVKGQMDIFGILNKIQGYSDIPFLNTLFVKGDGTLSVASSGFVFHSGEWTLDFFNGFDKTLATPEDGQEEDEEEADENPEDESLNGSLKWAVGGVGDRLNPLRQIMIDSVYFNKHSLFAAPSFSIGGFGLSFNDFILRDSGVSFGGTISLKIVEAEIKNVIYNDKGFVGIDANLKFNLGEDMGLLQSQKPKGKDENGEDIPGDVGDVGGEINIVHYEQEVEDVSNTYGLKFNADLKNIAKVDCEIAFKKVDDGRILPDVIAFGSELPDPGILITGATYLTGIRGALRELADTIAGGSSDIPLTVEAGVDISFGLPPATFYGSIDLALKLSGIKIEGKLDYAPSSDSDRVEMLTMALIEAQWMTPWFVRAEAEVDIFGWDVIIGNARIFVGQNLEKNRIDFEGFVGAKVQIPSDVPLVGGIALGSVFMGLNNDKIWGGISIGIGFIQIPIGITYYWVGDLEFGTSGEGLPEGLMYLQVETPEGRPKLIAIGQGIEPVATSWVSKENEIHEIIYRSVGEGVSVLDNGSMNLGIGGIEVSNSGKMHTIPVDRITGNALLEVEYFEENTPEFTLKDNEGNIYPVVFYEPGSVDQAVVKQFQHIPAFIQHIKASDSVDSVDTRKAYVAIPKDLIKGGNWTLYSSQRVESKLLNIPEAAGLDEIRLTKSSDDTNKFTAAWKASNAEVGDTVSLYLTKDAVTEEKDMVTGNDGQQYEVPATKDPGIIIAKDLPVGLNGSTIGESTTGSIEIDVAKVSLLGNVEDIRGLVKQGNYYLRAELKSTSNFSTKTSADKFEIIDPLAPFDVSNVEIKAVGNGYFELSFKPDLKKPGQENYERSYYIDIMQEVGEELTAYPNFGTIVFEEKVLRKYWNETAGKYEHIRLGGWTAVSSSNQVDNTNLTSNENNENMKYTGLEVGKEYVVGVTSAVRPPITVDKNENLHFGNIADSQKTLLPIPQKPKLSAQTLKSLKAIPNTYIELLTNTTEQTVQISADQKDVEVEVIYAEKSIAKTELVNNESGSTGTIQFNNFTTDGTYAIELKARNKNTGDFSITMLYLTVDTISPVIYIKKPVTGDRTSDGRIAVAGTTSNDAILTVNGNSIPVERDGRFDGTVNIASNEPTVSLEFVAIDRAGNQNKALVDITNDSFEVPVGLVLRKPAKMQKGEAGVIEVFVRYNDGKDSFRKAKYREVPVSEEDRSKLSFSNYLGEAVDVGENGKILAIQGGSSIISASYKVSESTSLESMTVVSVTEENFENITMNSVQITSVNNKTRINILNAGELKGFELVYKVGTNVAVPILYDDLSGWAVLPANGEIEANQGDYVVIAKRSVTSKLAVGSSAKTATAVWNGSSGNGGNVIIGGGSVYVPPVKSAETIVNDKAVAAEKKEDKLITNITGKDIVASDINIITKDGSVNSYEFNLDKDIGMGRNISIDTPIAIISLPADTISETNSGFQVNVSKNNVADAESLADIAGKLNADILGQGQGVTFDIPSKDNIYLNVKVAVPDNIHAEDITAVILKAADGSWTTIPWKLDIAGNKAYVDASLTGNGSIGFISNKASFADVGEDFWGKKSIDEAAKKLYILGKDTHTFEPENNITRAEYATILLRIMGLMNKESIESFTDVNDNDWFRRSVAVASQRGIIKGYEDATFRPNADVSRMQAMVMIGRALKFTGVMSEISDNEVNDILSKFTDNEIVPEWARREVAICIKNGIIVGENAQLSTENSLTRAQAAAITVRLDKLIISR